MSLIGFRAFYASALSVALAGGILSGCSGGSGGSNMVPSPSQGGTTNSAPVPTGDQSGTSTSVNVSDSDIAAAAGATNFKYHILAPLTSKNTGVRPQSVVFPSDLTFGGGAVLKTVVS